MTAGVDTIDQFRAALRARGIVPPDKLVDGRIGRANVDGKNGKGDASYIIFLNGVPAGGFENHKDGLGWESWRADLGRDLSRAEQEAQRAYIDDARRKRDAEEARRRAKATTTAAGIWQSAGPAPEDHEYLRRKGIKPHGASLYRGDLVVRGMACDGALLIPLRDCRGGLHSLEFVAPDGTKRFFPGAKKRGHYFAIGNPGAALCICEGFATGASIHEATAHAAAVAFDAGNLEPVARALPAKFPGLQLVLCADDDETGRAKATAAARAVGGLLAVPDFGDDRPETASDFNDLALHRGVEAVAVALSSAKPPEATKIQRETLAGDIHGAYRRRPLDWRILADGNPPERDWAILYWLGMGHATLLPGVGGIGKSLLAQQAGSAIALGRAFIDAVPRARKVLLWAGEDDADELWRRQHAIATSMGVGLGEFAGRFIVESFDGRDCTLAAIAYGRFGVTPMLEELRQQVNDEHVDVVILDNIARVFGGDENSRHQVTAFMAELVGATADRRAAILLLGHPGRAPGSEFSGSSAWENAVRSRWWFGDRVPDQPSDDDTEPTADGVRYLARRKSNYSARDLRTFHYRDGVFVSDPAEIGTGGLLDSIRRDKADRVTMEAFRKLMTMGLHPSDGSSSPNYLPRLIIDYKFGEGLTKRELADAMRRLMTDRKLRRDQVGTYGNRNPRMGLVEA